MPNIYYCLILILFILISTTSYAIKPPKAGNVVITMRHSTPCFSYPQDKSSSFSSLYISNTGTEGRGGWAIQIKSADRKGLLDPNNPDACVKYGVLNPGMEIVAPAETLQFDTPYRARLNTNTTTGVSYESRYVSDFCITRSAKGETILVGADWDDKSDTMKCLKPGESAKRGFWQRLFGK
jgi:hypothetical protein